VADFQHVVAVKIGVAAVTNETVNGTGAVIGIGMKLTETIVRETTKGLTIDVISTETDEIPTRM